MADSNKKERVIIGNTPKEEESWIASFKKMQDSYITKAFAEIETELAKSIDDSIVYKTSDGRTITVKKPRPSLRPIEEEYIESPTSESNTVLAKDGKEYPREDCIYIAGAYFHKSDTKNITTDCMDGKLIGIRNSMEITSKLSIIGGKPVEEYGRVSAANYEYSVPYSSNKYKISGRISSEKNIEGWEFKESLSEAMLVDKEYREKASIEETVFYDQWKNPFFKDSIDINTKLKLGIISPSYRITEGNKYSIGVEMEVARGFIPRWKANRFNIGCIRDGSLNGGQGGAEYVTGILRGDTGFNHLQEICNELQSRTTVDRFCGLHLHIGGLNFSNTFLVNMYLLCQIIEKDVQSILPKSRRDNLYCRPLKKFKFSPVLHQDNLKAKEDYLQLFRWIAYEKAINPSLKYNKTSQHPMGYKCNYNHDTPRYCWINFVPAVFKTRERIEYKTIEFRSMEGTTNFTKVKNWALLCLAIVKFADKYPDGIREGLTVNDILMKVYPNKGCKLVEYFNERREIFASSSFNEEEWYKNDSSYLSSPKSIKDLCI